MKIQAIQKILYFEKDVSPPTVIFIKMFAR